MKKHTYIFNFYAFSMPYSAHAATATVSASTCAQLTEHVADSSIAYKPGVDAMGRKVAPADLGGGFKFTPPKEIKIPIQITPEGNSSSFYSTSYTNVETVTYWNGQVYFNDKPLQDNETTRIDNAGDLPCRSGL